MRHDKADLKRLFEPRAKFAAHVQVKESGFLGLRGEYQERYAVLVPREPPIDAPSSARIIHSQLLLYTTHIAAQPRTKLWTDGASMEFVGDKYHLKLHHTHAKPASVRVDIDEGNNFNVCFRASAMDGHAREVHRLASIINATLRASQGQPLGGVTASGSSQPHSRPVPQSPPQNQAAGTPRPDGSPAPNQGGAARVSSAPMPAMSGPLAASLAIGGGNTAPVQHAPSGSLQSRPGAVYPGQATQPSAPTRTSSEPPRQSSDAQAATDEELASRLQQSELQSARMTDSDLHAHVRRWSTSQQQQQQQQQTGRTGSVSAATPPVPPPPAGKPTQEGLVCHSHGFVLHFVTLRRLASYARLSAGSLLQSV